MGDPSGIRQMIDSYFEPDRGPEWVRRYMFNAGVTFSDDRRIFETWLVNGRFPLHFIATGTEEVRALGGKGLPIKQHFMIKKQACCARRAPAAASRPSPTRPIPTPRSCSSTGF